MTPTALVRRPSPRLAGAATLTFRAREPVDPGLLEAQHRGYREALGEGGYRVVEIPGLPDQPDGTFVEDLGVGFPEAVVLGRAAATGRAGELEATLPALTSLLAPRPLHRIEAPGTLDGGDVLPVGRVVLVGASTRTNPAGIQALTGILAPLGYAVRTIPVAGALHLRTACSALDRETLLANPRWLETEALDGFRLLPVPEEEPFGANVLPLPGGGLLVSASAPRTADLLAARGARVRLLDISGFEKAEGGLTCLSLRIPLPGAHPEDVSFLH